MATKLNPNAIIDSSISKEKLQLWVIKWDDTEIDAAIWDELTAFDELPDKIPNIVFMDEYFNVFRLFNVKQPTDDIRRLLFTQIYGDNVTSLKSDDTYLSVSQVDINKPIDNKCSISVESTETEIHNVIADFVREVISDSSIDGTKLKDATVTPSKLAPSVMQHLEAITIYTDNTAEHKAANLANIKAYEDNLKAMGVDVTKDHSINIITGSNLVGFVVGNTSSNRYNGYLTLNARSSRTINIDSVGYYSVNIILSNLETYNSLTTTDKRIIPAINEVNDKIGDIDTILDKIIG